MAENKKHILSFCLVTALFFTFQLFYFNRFLPIQDGWFIEYAKQISSGKLIYKDFQVFVQPVYVFIFSWISDLFGNNFIVFRFYGLFERALLIGVTYLLFAQITNAYRAAFLTLLGLFLFITNTADVIYSYYQLVAVFVFTSAYFLILYYRNDSLKMLLLAGIFSGLAFITKQSTGTLVPVALLLTIVTLRFSYITQPKNKLFTTVLFFICGFVIPVLVMLGYIYHLGVLNYYWDQVFASTNSKGKLSHILFSFWGNLLSIKQFFSVSLFFILFYILNKVYLERYKSSIRLPSFVESNKKIFVSLGLTFLVMATLIPWIISYRHNFNKLNFIYTSINFFSIANMLAYVCIYLNALLVVYYFRKAMTKTLRSDELSITIISVTSFAFMWGHGLSGFIEPHATIVSAGLMFLLLLNTNIKFNNIKNATIYILIIFIICMCAFGKAAWMYSWWGWDERSAWTANNESVNPLLKGFKLNDDKVEIIDGITKLIQENSNEGESIYIFPHMPMFYLLANRPHKTFSAVHYFDVCSDALAKSDANIVVNTKPKVIVYMEFPEKIWSLHEKIFRDGKRSSQRDFKEFIERVKNDGEYKVVETYITSGYGYNIEILVKEKVLK
jgi:hypothetical protein